MSSMMWGADVEALEELGKLFRSRGETVRLCYTQVRTAITQTPWEGEDGETFHVDWDGPHRARLDVVATGLITLGDDLIRQAAEQRRASGDGGGSSPGTVPTGDGTTTNGEPSAEDDGGYGIEDAIGQALLALGLSHTAVETLLELLEANQIPAGQIADLLGNDGLKTAIKVAGPVLDVAGFVMDFVEGASAFPDLPWDEQVVRGLTVASIGLGVDKGAEVLGAAIGSAIPGLGTAAGIIVGKIVGVGMGIAYDAIDGAVGVTDFAADQVLAVYQDAKAHDFNPVSMGLDVAGDVVDGVKDGAGAVKDGAGAVVDFLNPWN